MTVRLDDLLEYEPLTENQNKAFEAWDDDFNLVLAGSAGTGKTFVGMYLGLEAVLDPNSLQDRLIIVRSMVPTRDMGYLPGTKVEKEEAYITPYKAIACDLFGDKGSWSKAISSNKIQFESTSFIRGVTVDNAVILVDEMQNLNFHELDSIITRVGENSRIIFCGDASQTDLVKTNDRNGIHDFLNILRKMPSFDIIEFGIDDIVRSGLVKEYIIAKLEVGL